MARWWLLPLQAKLERKKKSGRKPRELLGTARLQVLPSGRSERLQIPR